MERVLIVEDESVVAMELEERVAEMGYAVAGVAADEPGALAELEDKQPTLVLMDIRLRGPKDGIATAEEIRARVDIPIIYLTAHADEATLKRARSTQPAGYLVKPVRDQELRAACEMAVYKYGVERRLRDQEEQLGGIAAGLPGIVFQFVARPDGTPVVSHAMGRIEAVLGLAAAGEDLFDRLLAGVDPHDRPGLLSSIVAAVNEFRPWEYEGRFTKPSGETMWFRALSTPTQRKPNTVFNGLLFDITEQKLAEQALTESEDRYRDLVENSHEIICTHDLQGRILFANRTSSRLLGYPPEELVGRNIRELLPPEVQGQFDAYLATIQAEGTASGSMQVRTRTGEKRTWEYDNSLRPGGSGEATVRAIARDITERRRAQEALRESEARFRALVENSSDIIAILNPDGSARYESPAHERLLGYTAEEMSGAYPMTLVHPEDLPALLNEFVNGLPIPGYTVRSECRLQHKDGSWRSIELIARNLIEDPAVGGIVVNSRDVTERKRAEQEIHNHLAELEAVNRISSALRAAQTLDEMLPILVKETAAVMGAAALTLWLYEPTADELRVAAGNLMPGADPICKPGIGLTGHVFSTGQPYVSNQLGADPLVLSPARELMPEGLRGIGVPIRVEQTTIGVMSAAIPTLRELNETDVRLFSTIAEIAGNAIHRTRLNEATQRHLLRMQALHHIDGAINNSHDLKLILGTFLTHLAGRLGVDAANVLKLNLNLQSLEFVAGIGFRRQWPQETFLRLSDDLAGQVVLDRKTIAVRDLSRSGSPVARSALVADEGFVTYFGVPLIAKGRVNGILQVFHRRRLEPDREWLDYLETLAEQAAIAIDNTELFAKMQRANMDLALAYDTTLEGWSRALDLRDRRTQGHTQRAAELTVRLARRIGLDDEALVQIRRGALLHDIGKMGIPDNILNKPGPLTDEEWETMRKHPQLGYELLSPIAYLRPALDIPYHHHEKWDGTGYPHGLAGERIPLAARIFSIVDVWDALTSDRPYRAAWSKERAREHMDRSRATHFDPVLVETFLRLIEDE